MVIRYRSIRLVWVLSVAACQAFSFSNHLHCVSSSNKELPSSGGSNNVQGAPFPPDLSPRNIHAVTLSITLFAGASVFGLDIGAAHALNVPPVVIQNSQEASLKSYQSPAPSSAKQIQKMIQSDQSASSASTAIVVPKKGELQASDVKKIAQENRIEVELICKEEQRPLDLEPPIVTIDRKTFQKVKIYQPPFLRYLPSSVQPLVSRQFQSLQVLKSIPDDQLFVASVFAGSLTEMIRTTLLYPLSTVKARVQARTSRQTNRKRPLLRKLRVTWLTFLFESKRGDWYAGILPSLLVTVPASGVYSGLKEVSRRAFSMAIEFQMFQNLFPGADPKSSYESELVVNLLSAFVADIAALAIRTPGDVLALRLQVFGDNNIRSDYSDWIKDSWALLTPMIITDLPFLLVS